MSLKTMTLKNLFSLDQSLFEVLPYSTMARALFPQDFDIVVQSGECVNTGTCSQNPCLVQSSAAGSGPLFECKQTKIDLNRPTGERNYSYFSNNSKEDSNDVSLHSAEMFGANAILREVELLQIGDAIPLTDDDRSLECCNSGSVNKPKPLLKCHVGERCNEHKCFVPEGSPSSLYESAETCSNVVMLNIFDNLPLEIQHKILSFLTPSELCCSVAPVCRRWHDLAYEPILWQKLAFGHTVPSDTITKILKRSTLVRFLSLFGFPELSVFIPQLVNCSFLLCLDFKMCGGLFAESINLLVHYCPLVESLNVEGCRNIDNTAVAEIVGWKRMKCLNLSHCTLVQDESVVRLAQELNHLQELNIDGIENISDAAVTIVVDQRKGTLQKLLLDGEDLTDVTYCFLGNCTGLNELCVSFAVLMSDQGLVAIKELTRLRNLKIKRGSELSESGLQALFESQNLCHLISLDLSGCSNLEDTGVDNMTKCCSRLQLLGLEWCWDVSDKGLDLIVSRCSCLKVMNLVGLVKITGACFAKVPDCMPHLVHLDLQQCSRILDDIVEDVVRRKPDLKVLDYYGEELHTELINGVTLTNSTEQTSQSDPEESYVCTCGQHIKL